jgi:hypothetical protein
VSIIETSIRVPGITAATNKVAVETPRTKPITIYAIDGGIKIPVHAPEATSAAAYGLGYPEDTSRSIVILPTDAQPAASDPEMQEKKPHPRTVDVPNPDLKLPAVASATESNLFDKPVRTSASPVKINNGTANKANASIPSKSVSPRRLSGSVPVKNKRAETPIPMETHMGIPRPISTTIANSGKAIPQLHSTLASMFM